LKILKWLGIAVGLVVLLVAGGIGFLAVKAPASRPAMDVKVEATPELVARGEYIVRHRTPCFSCHAQPDESIWGVPAKPGTEGLGQCFPPDPDFPGRLCAANITPSKEHGIGAWTDGEVMRAIREGVDRKGNALFPMMPYGIFREMSDGDLKAVVAYIRTIPAFEKATPRSEFGFPPPPMRWPTAAISPPSRAATPVTRRSMANTSRCLAKTSPAASRSPGPTAPCAARI
jgi:hypothetical protein